MNICHCQVTMSPQKESWGGGWLSGQYSNPEAIAGTADTADNRRRLLTVTLEHEIAKITAADGDFTCKDNRCFVVCIDLTMPPWWVSSGYQLMVGSGITTHTSWNYQATEKYKLAVPFVMRNWYTQKAESIFFSARTRIRSVAKCNEVYSMGSPQCWWYNWANSMLADVGDWTGPIPCWLQNMAWSATQQITVQTVHIKMCLLYSRTIADISIANRSC